MTIKPNRYDYSKDRHIRANASTVPFQTLYFHDRYVKREKSPCCFKHLNSDSKKLKNKKNRSTRHAAPAPSVIITTYEYLKILAKQCSLPNVLAIDDNATPKRCCSAPHFNTNTPFKTKYIIKTLLLKPTVLPSNYLDILMRPLIQAQLRINQYQVNVKQGNCCCSCESKAVFEFIDTMQEYHDKKDKVKQRSMKKKPQQTQKAPKPAVNTAKYDLLTPFAGHTVKKRESILKDVVTLVVPPLDGPTNSPNVTNTDYDFLIFPLKQKSGHYKVQDSYKIQWLHPTDGKNPELHMDKETMKEHSTLEKTAAVRESTVKVFVEKDLSNADNHKKDAEVINFTRRNQTHRNEKTIIQNISLLKKNIVEKVRNDFDQPVELTNVANEPKKPVPQLPRYNTRIDKKAVPDAKNNPGKIYKDTKEIRINLATGSRSGKRSKGRAGSLWTPLEGMKPKQKEKVLRGLIQHGISLPEGNTESVKKLFSKVKKDMGLPPTPKTKSAKEKYATGQALGLITPLHGKSKLQKERILRALAKENIILPQGRTDSEKVLIIKIGKEPRNSSDAFHKNKAVSPKTRLQGKLLKRGVLLPQKKVCTASNEIKKREVKLLVCPPHRKEKEKCTDANLINFSKPLNKNNVRQEEKTVKRLKKINKVSPEDITKLKKALIDTVRNELTSSITSSKVSTEAYEMLPNNKEMSLTLSTKNNEKNNEGLSLIEIYDSSDQTKKCFKPKIDEPSSLLEGISTPQKDRILKALAENSVVLPKAKLLPGKFFTNLQVNKTEIVPSGQPILLPLARKQCHDGKIKIIDFNNKGKGNLLKPVINKITEPEQKPPLDSKTIEKSAVKVTEDTLKERSRILHDKGVSDGRRNTSHAKLENKTSVQTRNDFVGLNEPLGKNLNNVKNESTATYTASLRLEEKLYNGEEFMTTAQKTMFQALSTYLAEIDVDLL